MHNRPCDTPSNDVNASLEAVCNRKRIGAESKHTVPGALSLFFVLGFAALAQQPSPHNQPFVCANVAADASLTSVQSLGGSQTRPWPSAPPPSRRSKPFSAALAAEWKTFGVPVAIAEPGIIGTAMTPRIGESPLGSVYRQRERFGALFTASLENPVPPFLVAQKILEVSENGTWQPRHPVGPDAIPLLGWRKSFTDEEWVDLNASDDETWSRRRGTNLGIKTKAAN